jgi:arylsulfatase
MTYIDEEFKGAIGRTVEESIPHWPEPIKPSKDAPNVVVILLDDMGFAQLGCYGSDISTPNIDRLAEGGLRYNNFHTTAMCSPTRASLLTGRNPHQTGLSFVSEFDSGFPNCTGKVRKDTAMISEMLLEAGYNTYAVGKWHLIPGREMSHVGPFDGWPLGRGFEHYYGFLSGATNQYYPDLVEDNSRVPQPKTPMEGYHLTEDLTDKAIEYIRNQKSENPDVPFFCYLSYAAPHAPHQAPKEFIDKYKGKYDKGWDKTREEWFERQKELGIIPQDAKLPPRNPGVKLWDELSEDEKRLFARMQEVFAGFLEHTDYHIGRFVETLRELNQLDNTLVVFLSDNGACSMGGDEGVVNAWSPNFNPVPETFESKLERIDDLGTEKANSHYPKGWAQAGNTPLKMYKTYTHAGGVRCPLIIHYPNKIKEKGGVRKQFHHVTDIMPTILELTGVKAPEVYKGIPQKPIYGTSLTYTFEQPDTSTKKEVQHFEISSNRAIWYKGWKAVTYHKPNTSFDEDVWELYDTENDFSEYHNLADVYPEKVEELVDLWWKEAEKYDVFPIDGRSLDQRLAAATEQKGAKEGPVYRVFHAAPSSFGGKAAPDVRNKSFQIQAEIVRKSIEEDGVITAHGDESGGYTLFIKNNKLIFHFNFANLEQYVIQSEIELPAGSIDVRFRLEKTKENEGVGRLFLNNVQVGEGLIKNLYAMGSALGLFYVGENIRAAISKAYEPPFTFKGELKKVAYSLGGYKEDLETAVLEELRVE